MPLEPNIGIKDAVDTSPAQIVETYESLSALVDVHALRADASSDEVAEACRMAAEYGVRSIVVRPIDAELALRSLTGTGVTVASTVSYPDGASNTATKLYELRDLLRLGMKEVDWVLSPGKLIDRQFQHLEVELLQASRSCQENGAVLKVVLQNRYLPDDRKIIAAKICRRVEAHFLSIDYTQEDTALLLPLLKDRLLLKCATPVENLQGALAARSAGFHRFAVSDALAPILSEWKQHLAQTVPATSVS